MNLQDVFTALTYGELKHLSLGNFVVESPESAPAVNSYAALMSSINLGLTALHKRFLLKTEEIYVQQYSHIEIYTLAWKYAVTNEESTEEYKYIIDSPDNPFQDNVLKIEECYNEIGELLVLNDRSDEASLFTPTYRSIQVPEPVSANVIGVQYRADHPRLIYTEGMVAADIEIELPWSLLDALLFYVAMRIVGGLNKDNDAEANNYLKKYEMVCVEYSLHGLNVQPELGNSNFDCRGWR